MAKLVAEILKGVHAAARDINAFEFLRLKRQFMLFKSVGHDLEKHISLARMTCDQNVV